MLSSSSSEQHNKSLILTTPTLGTGNATIFLCEKLGIKYKVFVPKGSSLENEISKEVGSLASSSHMFLTNTDNFVYFSTSKTINDWHKKVISSDFENDFVKSRCEKFKALETLTVDEKNAFIATMI